MIGSHLLKKRLTMRELRKQVNFLKRLSLERADLEFLKAQLLPIVHCYIHPTPVVSVNERLYRGVPWPEKPSHVGQISYPPPSKVTTYQRVNRPSEPVFYASVGSSATVMELAPHNTCRITLSTWAVRKQFFVASIGYTEDTFRRIGSDRWSQIWWQEWRAGDPQSALSQENRKVQEFLAKEFTRRVKPGSEWQYKLSVAISELFLQTYSKTQNDTNGFEVSGILYPSVASDANSDNLALKRHVVDDCLEFVSVQYVEVSPKPNRTNEFDIRGLDFANSLSSVGVIEWRGTFPSQHIPGADLHVEVVDGKLVVMDWRNVIVGAF